MVELNSAIVPGRTPKHVDEKVNRSRPPVPPQTLPLHHDLKAPPLPRGRKWTAKGKRYWEKVWQSPMAITFIDADLPGLERMVELVELIDTAEQRGLYGLLAELRQLEDRFGMSPLARRRLQWDIDRAAGLHNPEQVESKDDDRFLRVVS